MMSKKFRYYNRMKTRAAAHWYARTEKRAGSGLKCRTSPSRNGLEG